MVQTESKEIGGRSFAVTQLPAMRAAKLLHRLGKAVAPALAKAAGGKSGGDLMDLDLGNLADAVQLLFDRLPEADFEAIVRQLLETATVTEGGRSAQLMSVFDTMFAGDMGGLFQLVQFALEVNFGPFLRGLVNGGRALLGIKAQSSSSPSASDPSGPATA